MRISISSNLNRSALDYAEEIIRGAFNKTDSSFRESQIGKSMKGIGLCHGHTAKFIRESRFSPDTYLMLMGSSISVDHSIVLDDNGILYDRDADKFEYLNNNEVKYTHKKDPYKVLGVFNIGKLLGPYMNNGTYIQVEPDNISTGTIYSLLAKAKIPISERKKDLHCTLMYSPTKDYIDFVGEKRYVPDINKEYRATITGVTVLGDAPILSLVLLLNCPELDKAHSKMKAAGLKHTFPDLLQHITVASGPELKMREYQKQLQATIAATPSTIRLIKESASALKPT